MGSTKWKRLFLTFFALTLLFKVTEAHDSGQEWFATSQAEEQGEEATHKCEGVCTENLQKADSKCKKGQGLVPSYLIFDPYCKDCECRNDNNCSYTRGVFGGINKKCQCEDGYEEMKGVCVGTCKSNPCQNEGDCVVVEQDIECKCKEQFTGTRCEKKLGVLGSSVIGGAVGIAAGTLVGVVAMPVVLPLLGFSAGGIAAGSIAAGIQSGIGNVAAGSLFAAAQSAGVVGMAASTQAAIAGGSAAVGSAIGAAVDALSSEE